MVKMINALTGGVMLVPEALAEKYKAAGHKPAAAPAAREKTARQTKRQQKAK